MSKTKPTLRDVARRAGTSGTAASLALREHPKSRTFSPNTVERIHAAARELGYRPNFFSSQMRKQTAQVVMVYLNTLEDPYAGKVAESFQQRAAQRGYWTMVQVCGNYVRRTPLFDDRIIGEHGISAVALISQAADLATRREIEHLKHEGVHIATVGRAWGYRGVSEIGVNDYHGGQMAAEHMYGLGLKRLWVLVSYRNKTKVGEQNRVQAIIDYARENGLPEPILIECAPEDKQEVTAREIQNNAYRACQRSLESHGALPDGVIANIDLRAFGAYRAIYEAGYRPGTDVPVMGYDDIWPAESVYPALTTIRQPATEMGTSAADILLDSLEKGNHQGRHLSIEPELIVRESTHGGASGAPTRSDSGPTPQSS